MIDLFYVLGPGSHYNDLELRASMWSAVKHLKNFGRIFVAGEAPRCGKLPRYTQLDSVDPWGRSKEHRIQSNLRAALLDGEGLSEEFLYMNDDFFFCADCDAPTYPYYTEGSIPEAVMARVNDRSSYGNTLINALFQLQKRALPLMDFCTHSPFRVERTKLRQMFDEFDFSRRESPNWKLLYGNMHRVTPTHQKGCKLAEVLNAKEIAEEIKGRNCFSVGDIAMNSKDLRKMLEDYYYVDTKV